ncbi:hypothetical protein J3D55_002371 [Chryseobacterium ginsenosidimutans]|uniref:hypothetical protein n=1 Tax=Chryseobacterium ginsenosidimutans TaxID=687846 RepID=UPI002166D8B9|nr:hypothetical protein [Chryseobacterium ginsenosidimutans]MCS3869455.1 hypothetical protein [Chryseobacterium ginsenosidimutans]
MAIYGAGSNWDGDEIKDDFFANNNYVIGWDINDAQDLYNMLSTVKIGDIIYLKANRPGSLDLRIKGIGIVRNSLLNILFEKGENLSSTRNNFELPVEWIDTDEFFITIPSNTGKLTNVRAATLYEEFLPFVQNEIINKIIAKIP